MSLELLNSPIYATIQDEGRFGYEQIGISQGGVMDLKAYKQLNMLLYNKNDASCIEILFGNIQFLVNKSTIFATTGAICELYINDEIKNNHQSYSVNQGDIIKIGKVKKGVRVYLSVKDGFSIKKDFGSVSTSLKLGLGGLNRDKLKKGDILEFNENKKPLNTKLKKEYLPIFEDTITLRVLLSYQHNHFSKEQKDLFFSSTYTITNDFNAMACKLDGEAINCNINSLVSEGICFGAIQIPPDGKPIILLNERQTIGGYPKIGAVLSVDCYKLAQAKPKMKVVFQEINIDYAREVELKFLNSFDRFL